MFLCCFQANGFQIPRCIPPTVELVKHFRLRRALRFALIPFGSPCSSRHHLLPGSGWVSFCALMSRVFQGATTPRVMRSWDRPMPLGRSGIVSRLFVAFPKGRRLFATPRPSKLDARSRNQNLRGFGRCKPGAVARSRSLILLHVP